MVCRFRSGAGLYEQNSNWLQTHVALPLSILSYVPLLVWQFREWRKQRALRARLRAALPSLLAALSMFANSSAPRRRVVFDVCACRITHSQPTSQAISGSSQAPLPIGTISALQIRRSNPCGHASSRGLPPIVGSCILGVQCRLSFSLGRCSSRASSLNRSGNFCEIRNAIRCVDADSFARPESALNSN